MGAEPPPTADAFPRLLEGEVFLVPPPLFLFLVEPSESRASELLSHMDLGRVLRFTNWSLM